MTGDEVESKLRALGFGYRAKYIAATARIIAGKPKGWLNSLRNPEEPAFPPFSTLASNCAPMTYKHAHKELLQLSGVGPKVADCICLMGLGWAEAVPVDTHVWQIAQRDYKFGKGKAKTFSTSLYHPVGDFFRDLWGKEAGWAHSVLFTADLKTFSDRATKEEKITSKVKREEFVNKVIKEEEVKEEEVKKVIKEEESELGVTASRKRQRASSLKAEEPELKVHATEVRRSRRIRTKGNT